MCGYQTTVTNLFAGSTAKVVAASMGILLLLCYAIYWLTRRIWPHLYRDHEQNLETNNQITTQFINMIYTTSLQIQNLGWRFAHWASPTYAAQSHLAQIKVLLNKNNLCNQSNTEFFDHLDGDTINGVLPLIERLDRLGFLNNLHLDAIKFVESKNFLLSDNVPIIKELIENKKLFAVIEMINFFLDKNLLKPWHTLEVINRVKHPEYFIKILKSLETKGILNALSFEIALPTPCCFLIEVVALLEHLNTIRCLDERHLTQEIRDNIAVCGNPAFFTHALKKIQKYAYPLEDVFTILFTHSKPSEFGTAIDILGEEGILTPRTVELISKLEEPSDFARRLRNLNENNLLDDDGYALVQRSVNEQLVGYFIGSLYCKELLNRVNYEFGISRPFAMEAIVDIRRAKLLNESNMAALKTHQDLQSLSEGMKILYGTKIFSDPRREESLLTQETFDQIHRHNAPVSLARAYRTLFEEKITDKSIHQATFMHKNPEGFANGVARLIRGKLWSPLNFENLGVSSDPMGWVSKLLGDKQKPQRDKYDALKSEYRDFLRINHPDKVKLTPEQEQAFARKKDAYQATLEALKSQLL